MPADKAIELVSLTPALIGDAAAIHKAALDRPWDSKSIARLLDLPTVAGALARREEEKGWHGLVLWQTVLDESEILTLAVAPPHRRFGLSRHLLNCALSCARAVGAVRMRLEVAEDNHVAQHLYRRCGFSIYGRRPGYYEGPDRKLDALLLERRLD